MRKAVNPDRVIHHTHRSRVNCEFRRRLTDVLSWGSLTRIGDVLTGLRGCSNRWSGSARYDMVV